MLVASSFPSPKPRCSSPTIPPTPIRSLGKAAGARAATARAQRLREIVENHYDAYLELNPLLATSQGDRRHDHRFGDYVSTAWMADSLAIEQDGARLTIRLRVAERAGGPERTTEVTL